MVEFEKRVLLLGCGAVGQCTLPLLLKHLHVAPRNLTVMDFEDKRQAMQEWTAQGVTFIQDRITPENLGSVLGRQLGAGDLLVDLAWNIDCCELLQWCHDHGVLYVNTSVELWNPYAVQAKRPTELTLYWRHMNIRRMTAGWKTPGPTAVLEHGANPGLISHWTKQGLVDIARKLQADRRAVGAEAEELERLIAAQSFNHLAMKLGVKVIHCSERDTQISSQPKQVDEFVNTWSIEGFREEGITTAEMGWGTHERTLPDLAFEHPDGPRNQICLARMGMNVRVRSWVPDYTIQGMVVRHGEAFTISDHLTVWEDGKAVYRPTVHYAYCPCDEAISSLHELRGNDYALQPRLRIMTDEVTSGADILGALLMGHAYSSWWTGSNLSIERSRELLPHQNATTLQVAISVAAAAAWIIRNPDRGVLVPDDLPHEFILEIARPYLGRNISTPSDWTPLKHRSSHFQGWNKPDLDPSDPWQFKNFLINERGD
ncbi:MAG: saccharopine dehydrogenase C-terminal domain-containing protein [Holophaga sp.]|nr:saccharopine dehydrogenase C-terminal domain-containing protein [Holophaga sp.]